MISHIKPLYALLVATVLVGAASVFAITTLTDTGPGDPGASEKTPTTPTTPPGVAAGQNDAPAVTVALVDEQDIIAPEWAQCPTADRWDFKDVRDSAFDRHGAEEFDYFRGVPAPDGGIYLFASGTSVSTDMGNVLVEHYDSDLNFVTSPDLGLHLLGFAPYTERHLVGICDVFQQGENYYVAFGCWDGKKKRIMLAKYDKNLKPLYKRPVFIDYGHAPALVAANDRIYVLYGNKYKDAKKKTQRGIFKMTIAETKHKIDGKDMFFVRRVHREMLPLDAPKDVRYPLLPHVVYNPARKEFCVVYNAVKREYLWGDHVAQIFDEEWKKKGAAVNLYGYFSDFRNEEKHDSVIPAVAYHNGHYFFSTDGLFKFQTKKTPKAITSIAIIKCDADLKKIAVRPLYGKMVNRQNKIETYPLASTHIFNYGGGLAVIGTRFGRGAALYKLDSGLNATSSTILKGGAPKKTELFIDSDALTSYPPKGILGYEQVLNVPINNRGLHKTTKPFNVTMYYGNKKVASAVIKKHIGFARQQVADLTWTVPDNIDQEEVEVRIVIDPENKIDDFLRDNNTLTLTIPVWDKGLVRGYIEDGSIDVLNWRPLEGATVTLTATGYNATVTADHIGHYEFERVPYGPYHLKIEQPGFNTLEEDHTLVKRYPVVTLRNELDNHGTFIVEVKPEQAAKKCTVLLSSNRFRDIDAEKTESGKYAADVPAGDYRVKITARGFLPYEIPNAIISLGQTNSTTITMEEATFAIVKGFVYDSYADPIANATVTFAQSGWSKDDALRPVYTATSDATGKFKISLTGYKKKSVRYQDSQNKSQTRIERGDKKTGTTNWSVHASAPGKPSVTETQGFRAGYEESYDICLAKPSERPKRMGVIEAYVPWTAKANFPGWLTYPELNAYAWYGTFATGITADFDPGRDELLTLHVGVQGLAYEMHAVSAKLSMPSSKPASKKMGWKKWGAKAVSLGSKLLALKNTIDDKPEDNDNQVPTVCKTICETLKENIHLGPTLMIPGVDKHRTSVRVDMVQIISTTGDNEGDVLWSNKQQWYSHTSHGDDSPNTHLVDFKLPRGFNRHKVKVVVYVKLQKLLLDGRTPDGLVPFYTCQYIKLEWNSHDNKLKATYEAEYQYRQTTGLAFD